MHDWHLENGGQMMEAGYWMRPLWYNTHGANLSVAYKAEMDIVREQVGMADVSDNAAVEASFNIDGERGIVDVLGFRASSGDLLVIEVKSVVPDAQAMLDKIVAEKWLTAKGVCGFWECRRDEDDVILEPLPVRGGEKSPHA